MQFRSISSFRMLTNNPRRYTMSNTFTAFVTLSNNTNKEVTMFITEEGVVRLVNSIHTAEFISLRYVKKDGTVRDAVGQLHVSNPRNTAVTPKGNGESATQALSKGRVKYYETHHKEEKTGVYRQCAVERLIYIKVRGVTYNVIH